MKIQDIYNILNKMAVDDNMQEGANILFIIMLLTMLNVRLFLKVKHNHNYTQSSLMDKVTGNPKLQLDLCSNCERKFKIFSCQCYSHTSFDALNV